MKMAMKQIFHSIGLGNGIIDFIKSTSLLN